MRTWLLTAGLLCAALLPAQTTTSFFKRFPEKDIALPDAAVRKLIPARYHTFELDDAGIRAFLNTAPAEHSAEARQHRCVVALPTAGGTTEEFAVWQTAVMEPALADKLPFIRTFAGVSLKDPRSTVHLSHTLRGFRAVIRRPDFTVEYVEPYAWKQDRFYMTYTNHDIPENERPNATTGWDPATPLPEKPERLFTPAVEDRGTLLDPIKVKVFRLVVATTGEFGQDHGDTKDEVFSAVIDYVNQMNLVYERDLNTRFQVVQASYALTYVDPFTDPFNGTTTGEWMGQMEPALNAIGVPEVAYDLGHVFARGGGGVAGGLACVAGKARGCTTGSGSYGYFVTILCQEIGHQLAAGHTWNRCGGNAPDQRKGGTAFEPGSGSTIMSYAGSCGPDNVQGYSDLYFHGGSIEEIKFYYTFGSGATCGTFVETNNNPPAVTLPYQDNFFIPIGTPFELDGSASDPDGDMLTYCWEQMDIGPETPLSTPVGSSPLFRTFPAVNVTNRYFPKLATIISNGFDQTEQLPGWTRDMTFRLTVRDNRPGGGGVGWADVAFRAWEGAGPFVVTNPNTNSSVWRVGEYARVSWEVANTDKAPVNCKRVNIRLSLDGGLTYPITLASNVNNDGDHYVLVPDQLTTKARVRIDGADNVFFDISNQNFKIEMPVQPSLTMGLNNDSGVLCLPAEHTVEIVTAGVLGYNTPVSLDFANPLPANVTATWSSSTLAPGESATLKLDFSKVAVEGVFTITVRAVSGQNTFLRDIVLGTIRNDFSGQALVSPPNGATELQLVQTLYWEKGLDAKQYDVQLASSPSFAPGTILLERTNTTLDSFKMSLFLNKGTPYFWRIRPINACGAHDWSDPFFFSTYAESCVKRVASDLPKNLTANGTPTVETQVTVNSGGAIKNMEVSQIKGYHEFFKDLDVTLTSPSGTTVTLWSARCGNFNGSFNLRLNDEAASAFPCPPPNNGLAYRPQNPMTPFIGENSTGTWTLRVRDTEYGGSGKIEAFSLEFCSEIALAPPYLVNNNPLSIEPGNNKFITSDLLLVEDPNNTHAQLIFTLLTVPEHGSLTHTTLGTLQPGAQFTQADIDNGALRYYDFGSNPGADGFYFIVTDGEGGFFGTPRFVIQPLAVSAPEPAAAAFDFRLFPNPANDAVWVAFDQPAPADMQLMVFNTAGQVVLDSRLAAGTDRLQLATAPLPRGMYFVQTGGLVRKLILK